MQKLKAQNFNNLSESIIRTLAQNRIVTILDFLQEDVSKLTSLTKLSLHDVLTIRNEIFTTYSAPLINGTALLTKVYKSRSRISSGIDSLDSITNGGFPVRHITEICGLADSGKSQLCFQLAINVAKDDDSTVLYVDTKGDFSAVRVQKMLDAQGYSHKDMASIMYRIRVVHIWTMADLVDLFKGIKNKALEIENLALVIVDSLPCLMFQHLGDDNKMGLSLLNILVNYSRFIANEFNVAIIYINIQTRWIDSDISDLEDDGESTSAYKEAAYIEKKNRCLGKYWESVPVLVLQLEKLDLSSKENETCTELKASIITSNVTKSNNNQCVLNLSTMGIT
ncbi:DNA repair protein RAD51 homolog 4 [Spodoptera frugiperda]|uniref:DNA repair protein RAD51 homolog 4 n=1 Tax=Spodoptera frugiperda TaxID=7108 RepID=A0A9R0D1A3_SPOFR|nr:DNA repair protein RAD51 homolog 4 [Spodoptera frugiperda]